MYLAEEFRSNWIWNRSFLKLYMYIHIQWKVDTRKKSNLEFDSKYLDRSVLDREIHDCHQASIQQWLHWRQQHKWSFTGQLVGSRIFRGIRLPGNVTLFLQHSVFTNIYIRMFFHLQFLYINICLFISTTLIGD